MELSTMLTAMKEVNLCTYFLLPLVGLNELSFGKENFSNCYLSRDLTKLYVRFYKVERLPASVSETSTMILKNESNYLVFDIPLLWQEDVIKYIAGKYSELSLDAKQTIRQSSSLLYKTKVKGEVYTDFRLLALEKSPQLSDMWKEHLFEEKDYYLFDEQMELLAVPGQETYYD